MIRHVIREGYVTAPYMPLYPTPLAARFPHMARKATFWRWYGKLTWRRQQVYKQDHPHSQVRITANVARGARGSALYFDVMIPTEHVANNWIAEEDITKVMDMELKKRKLVRVEKPFVHDDFCYHARAVRLSDWKKWMTRGTACLKTSVNSTTGKRETS